MCCCTIILGVNTRHVRVSSRTEAIVVGVVVAVGAVAGAVAIVIGTFGRTTGSDGEFSSWQARQAGKLV